MKVEFLPAAARELIEASEHYEGQLSGLGSAFAAEVERRCALLVELTSIGEKLDSIHRRLPLRRFPYAIIFRHDEHVIRVVAIAHRRRKPRYWARVQDDVVTYSIHEFEVSPSQEAELLQALAEVDRGEYVSGEQVLREFGS